MGGEDSEACDARVGVAVGGGGDADADAGCGREFVLFACPSTILARPGGKSGGGGGGRLLESIRANGCLRMSASVVCSVCLAVGPSALRGCRRY